MPHLIRKPTLTTSGTSSSLRPKPVQALELGATVTSARAASLVCQGTVCSLSDFMMPSSTFSGDGSNGADSEDHSSCKAEASVLSPHTGGGEGLSTSPYQVGVGPSAASQVQGWGPSGLSASIPTTPPCPSGPCFFI